MSTNPTFSSKTLSNQTISSKTISGKTALITGASRGLAAPLPMPSPAKEPPASF